MGDSSGWRVVALTAGLSVVLAACAAGPQSLGGWLGEKSAAPAASVEPSVYYVGAEGLKVYGQPSSSSEVVGTLSRDEKVIRTDLRRGYALVESTTTGIKGWVDNARLLWRLPAPAATAAPAAAGAPAQGTKPEEAPHQEPTPAAAEESEAPVAPEATPTVVEPPPEATAVPPGAPPSSTVGPSIFNPY